jgi:hypothetical protein
MESRFGTAASADATDARDCGSCCGRFEGEAKVTGVDGSVVRHQAGDVQRQVLEGPGR